MELAIQIGLGLWLYCWIGLRLWKRWIASPRTLSFMKKDVAALLFFIFVWPIVIIAEWGELFDGGEVSRLQAWINSQNEEVKEKQES